MEQYLTINGLWKIVAGTETEPSATAEKPKFLQNQQNERAHIALHVSPAQLSIVRLQNDPKDIWDELRRLNRPEGFGTRMALRRELSKMKKDPGMSMSMWIAAVRDVARQIKDLGGEVLDDEVIVVLTSSLPDSYTPLVVHLDSLSDSTRTISSTITRLVGEERRQAGERGTDHEDSALAFHAPRWKRKDISEVTCFGCGEKGHYRSECPAKATEKPAGAKGSLL